MSNEYYYDENDLELLAIMASYRRQQLIDHLVGPVLSLVFHVAVFISMLFFLVVGERKPEAKITEMIVQTPEEIEVVDEPFEPKEEVSEIQSNSEMAAPTANVPEEHNETPTDTEPFDSAVIEPLVSGLPLKSENSHIGIGHVVDGAGFGSTMKLQGDLTGYLYDLKRDKEGKKRRWNYKRDVTNVINRRFRASALNKFFIIPQKKYLSHLFLPKQKAENAPKAFKAEKSMKPRGFFVHYTGKVLPDNLGKYRFVGQGDDLLLVLVDGKVVLEANWNFHLTKWRPKENVDKYHSFTGKPLVYGSWINFKDKKPKRIDVIYGESPGGLMSALLMLEDKNGVYEKEANGRDILPIFALRQLSLSEHKRLQNYKGWNFAQHSPDFGNRKGKVIFDPNENISEGLIFEDI